MKHILRYLPIILILPRLSLAQNQNDRKTEDKVESYKMEENSRMIFAELKLGTEFSGGGVFIGNYTYGEWGVVLAEGKENIDISGLLDQKIDFKLLSLSYRCFFWDWLYWRVSYGRYSLSSSMEAYEDYIIYLLGVDVGKTYVNINKTYISFAAGFRYPIDEYFYVGAEAFEYIMKLGGNDGVGLSVPDSQSVSSANEHYNELLKVGKRTIIINPLMTVGIIF